METFLLRSYRKKAKPTMSFQRFLKRCLLMRPKQRLVSMFGEVVKKIQKYHMDMLQHAQRSTFYALIGNNFRSLDLEFPDPMSHMLPSFPLGDHFANQRDASLKD